MNAETIRTPFGLTGTAMAMRPYDDADEWDRLMVSALIEHRRTVRMRADERKIGLPDLVYDDAGPSSDWPRAAWITAIQ